MLLHTAVSAAGGLHVARAHLGFALMPAFDSPALRSTHKVAAADGAARFCPDSL